MQTDSAVDQLVRLGLTSYEARAYVALTGRDSFTAAQVSRLAGLPRQRIYDVLGSLVQKGLAAARPGNVVKYAATEPATAIERLVALRRGELAALEVGAAATIATLSAAYAKGQEQTDPLEYIEVLRDPGAINTRFGELQASVKKEILVFTKPPYAKPPQENLQGLEVAATHEARSVYEASIFDNPEIAAGVRRFIERGEQARVVRDLPLKLVIIDETIVMFGMQDPVAGGVPDLTIVVIEHPSLAMVLKVAFNAYWDRGLSFDEAARQFTSQPQAEASVPSLASSGTIQ
ncbi:MAG: TrmB family transcriptional regulator [Candidatus Dormibacteraeota bacterium]|nr:TrmB family transcriptional regulator [Candidatus Dormibacteraeota bacterium]